MKSVPISLILHGLETINRPISKPKPKLCPACKDIELIPLGPNHDLACYNCGYTTSNKEEKL